MWSGGDDCNAAGDPVRLYQPLPYQRRNSDSNNNDDGTCSFVGGPATTMPTCPQCHDSLYLILQLCVPPQGVSVAQNHDTPPPPATDKTLQVFCCNRASCVHHLFQDGGKFSHGGQGVVHCRRINGPSSTSETEATQQAPVTSASKPEPHNDWNMDNDPGDLADLEDRLASMEAAASSKPKASSAPAVQTKSNRDQSSKSSSSKSFPSFELSSLREPLALQSPQDVDDVGMSRDSDDKIQQMLAWYMAEEEDAEILAALRGRAVNTGGKGGKGGERDQRLSAQDRAMLTFSDRLKRCPRQVVRYAWGGVPLWSIPVPQPESKNGSTQSTAEPSLIPPCPGCGSDRVFEAQILPSLLHILQVDRWAERSEDVEENGNRSNSAAAASSALGAQAYYQQGGMDWGNLALFSCPQACDSSDEEFVVIQASVDEEPSSPELRRNYQEDACVVVQEEGGALEQEDEDDNMEDEEDFLG